MVRDMVDGCHEPTWENQRRRDTLALPWWQSKAYGQPAYPQSVGAKNTHVPHGPVVGTGQL